MFSSEHLGGEEPVSSLHPPHPLCWRLCLLALCLLISDHLYRPGEGRVSKGFRGVGARDSSVRVAPEGSLSCGMCFLSPSIISPSPFPSPPRSLASQCSVTPRQIIFSFALLLLGDQLYKIRARICVLDSEIRICVAALVPTSR